MSRRIKFLGLCGARFWEMSLVPSWSLIRMSQMKRLRRLFRFQEVESIILRPVSPLMILNLTMPFVKASWEAMENSMWTWLLNKWATGSSQNRLMSAAPSATQFPKHATWKSTKPTCAAKEPKRNRKPPRATEPSWRWSEWQHGVTTLLPKTWLRQSDSTRSWSIRVRW